MLDKEVFVATMKVLSRRLRSMETPLKTFYIESLGCAKNQVDSEILAGRLALDGWTRTDDPDSAALILVNTCGFINSAKQESLETVFALRNRAPHARIVVCGCLAQRYASDLLEDLPEADGIFGNRDLGQITSFVSKLDGGRQLLVPPYPADKSADFCARMSLAEWPGSAYLKISEGCSHHCRYCAIPLIRGELRSRPMHSILDEARKLADSGIREINVIAQDLAAYGTDETPGGRFLELLSGLAAIPGDFVIRLLYIHPDAFPEGLLQLIKDNPKILPYFDIPIQHASVKVLRAMGRTGDADTYFNLVSRIRAALPDAVIRTTMMLGFLNEDEQAFEELCDFIRRCRFDWMGSFVYSREEDTPAYPLRTEQEQQEIEKLAARRQKKLERIQQKITSERLGRFVGRQFDVLIEEVFEGQDLAVGRIYSQAPEVDGQTVVIGTGMVSGQVYRCGIRKVAGIDLSAVKIDE